ncbi:MAG TPA: hypothetical protein EYN85_09585, partial [Candidatus Lambdaproteobacteria bacterium]|nr:hypothetical protein [Candidatus Lambdaproteobacteria bacterium]
ERLKPDCCTVSAPKNRSFSSKLVWFGFVASSVFLGILILGLAYDWKKGALEWE